MKKKKSFLDMLDRTIKKAASGTGIDPTIDPRIRRAALMAAADEAGPQAYTRMQQPVDLTPESDTDLAVPEEIETPEPIAPPQPASRGIKGNPTQGIGLGGIMSGALALATQLLPDDDDDSRKQLNPLTYNPYAYGQGTQAIYKKGGGVDPDPKAFFKEYVNSPKYKERLKKQGYKNPEAVSKARSGRLSTIKYSNANLGNGAQSDGTITLDEQENKQYKMSMPAVKAHEISHVLGSGSSSFTNPYQQLNANEQNAINQRNKAFNTWPEHDSRPWEAKADIDTLRYMLHKDGIYNAGKSDFNKDTLKKAKAKYKGEANVKRLFDNFNDDDLIYLMNDIAYQDNGQSTQTMAKKGAQLSPSKAKEMLKDGTANGKKLTKKQKSYFGMVAAGKMPSGGGLTKGKSTKTPGQDQVQLQELLNFGILSGSNKNPYTKDQLSGLRTGAMSLYGQGADNQLLNDISLFNADPQYKNLKGEDRINAYYNRQFSNPLIKKIATELKSYGMTPAISQRFSPDVDVQAQQLEQNLYSNQQPQTGIAPMIVEARKKKGAMASTYAKGGTLNSGEDLAVLWGGGVESLSGSTLEFKGKSHNKGGIGILYGDQGVEVEGGETAFTEPNGTLTILGDMKVPGTNQSFKSVGRKIGKEEDKLSKKLDESLDLINDNDPMNRWQSLKFNAGKVMAESTDAGIKELGKRKLQLANIQRAMLIANPPKMKKGGWIEAAVGGDVDPGKGKKKQSLATRHNNPGNLKYAAWMKKYGAVPGETAVDGGKFAKFPDVAKGQQAMVALLKDPMYSDKSVFEAIKTWTNNSPYAAIPAELRDKKIKDLNNMQFQSLLDTITVGEDSKKYNWDGTEVPSARTDANTDDVIPMDSVSVTAKKRYEPLPTYRQPTVTPSNTAPFNYEAATYNFNRPTNTRPAPFQRGLGFSQIAPELFALANNTPDPVQGQYYTPELLETYRESPQQALNENQATFGALAERLTNNPEALSILASQKYSADTAAISQVDQRNLGRATDIANRNTQILNDAELRNIELADTQYTRQSTRDAKIGAQNQQIVNSLAGKWTQNRAENLDSQFRQMLFDFRPMDANDDGLYEDMEYQGAEPIFTPGGAPPGANSNPFTSTSQTFNAQGQLKSTRTLTPSAVQQQVQAQRVGPLFTSFGVIDPTLTTTRLVNSMKKNR